MDGESGFEKHRLDDKSGFGVGAGSRSVHNKWKLNWRHFKA